ncbi:MAG: hypothetical protein M3Q32_00110 [Pseudomonadota bacterium]|nr:hypothetical protein [Pseudomonadota bacterium]
MKNTPGSIKSALLAVPALALSSALMLPCAHAAERRLPPERARSTKKWWKRGAPFVRSTARAVVRALDCARCHGEPSLLTSVKERDAESFKRLSLEGNAGRGMPPYKSNERAIKNIDAIHAFFKGLADGTVPKGNLK